MTYEDPDIRIVNGDTGAISKVRVGPHLWGIAFDASSKNLYLAHTGTADVVSLNENTHKVNTIPVGSIPCAVAINPITHRIYAVNYGDGTLSVIDAAQSKVVATLPVGKHPQAIAIDPLHNLVYVANVHSNSVTVIDGSKNSVVGTYDAGRNPYALAVDPRFRRIYAANYGEPAVTTVDASTASVQK